MPSWFDDKSKEICTAKSRLFYDVLTPAASADCVHVPHIGELNRSFKNLCRVNYDISTFIFSRPVGWIPEREENSPLGVLKKDLAVAIKRYQQLGGVLVVSAEE